VPTEEFHCVARKMEMLSLQYWRCQPFEQMNMHNHLKHTENDIGSKVQVGDLSASGLSQACNL
jgi:hypothetical protein